MRRGVLEKQTNYLTKAQLFVKIFNTHRRMDMKEFNVAKFCSDLITFRGKETQTTFAKKMGINRTTLSLLENGKQIPTLENLTCFCNLAKKTTDEYFSEVTRDSLVYLMGSLEEADRIKVEEAMEKIRIKEKYRLLAKRSTV